MKRKGSEYGSWADRFMCRKGLKATPIKSGDTFKSKKYDK